MDFGEGGFGFVELDEVGADFALVKYFYSNESELRVDCQVAEFVEVLVLVFVFLEGNPIFSFSFD